MIKAKKKIYIIAGESSGDLIGSYLIKSIKELSGDKYDFHGIGGFRMEEFDFKSSFPMSDISVLGGVEILPHIFNIRRRIKQTISEIKNLNPDILITIDSPGFNIRVAKKIKEISNIKMVHYVAPTVWAYKPQRAKKFALIYEHLFLLFKFEKKYFDAVNLKNTFVGSPILEENITSGKGSIFREKYNIPEKAFLICVMPGTRTQELKHLLPDMIEAVKKLQKEIKNLYVVIPTIPSKHAELQKIMKKTNLPFLINDKPEDRNNLYAALNFAISKTGTSNIELGIAKVPMILINKLNFITVIILKKVIITRYLCILNIIRDKKIVPELLQENFTPSKVFEAAIKLIKDKKAQKKQAEGIEISLKKLFGENYTNPENNKPGYIAAKSVLDILEEKA